MIKAAIGTAYFEGISNLETIVLMNSVRFYSLETTVNIIESIKLKQ